MELTTRVCTAGGARILHDRPLNAVPGPHVMLAVAGVAVHVVPGTRTPAAWYKKEMPLGYLLLHRATTGQASDVYGGAFGLCRPGVGKPRAQGTRRLRAVLPAPAGRLSSATQYAAVATCPETSRTTLARIRAEGSHRRDAVVANPPPHRTAGHWDLGPNDKVQRDSLASPRRGWRLHFSPFNFRVTIAAPSSLN